MNAVRRRFSTLLLISGIALLRGSTAAVSNTPLDPFAWLQPVVTVDAAARGRIARGEVVVQILPAVDGELGVFAASRLDADPEMLAVWAASIEDTRRPHARGRGHRQRA